MSSGSGEALSRQGWVVAQGHWWVTAPCSSSSPDSSDGSRRAAGSAAVSPRPAGLLPCLCDSSFCSRWAGRTKGLCRAPRWMEPALSSVNQQGNTLPRLQEHPAPRYPLVLLLRAVGAAQKPPCPGCAGRRVARGLPACWEHVEGSGPCCSHVTFWICKLSGACLEWKCVLCFCFSRTGLKCSWDPQLKQTQKITLREPPRMIQAV